MSDWQLYTHGGTDVFLSANGSTFVQLKGYSGGLQFGMSDSLGELPGFDDGITRQIKESSQGAQSSISVRRIVDDAGQALARTLCGVSSDGRGFMRATYPGGRTITAEGIFHSLNENPVDAGVVQGFEFTFSQQEPETEA